MDDADTGAPAPSKGKGKQTTAQAATDAAQMLAAAVAIQKPVEGSWPLSMPNLNGDGKPLSEADTGKFKGFNRKQLQVPFPPPLPQLLP